jgi:sec-independent protein translocase protein TatC
MFCRFYLAQLVCFIAGGFFGYKMVYPASLDLLIGYGLRFQPMITIAEYTKLFLTIIIGLGLIFEMPILVFFLALMRVMTARWMWRNLRYSILAIFVVAAMVTPTTDILNMCLFAAPMVALYAISIGVAWLVNSARERRRGAA